MSNKEVQTHAMTTGGFSPFHVGHHEVVKQMIKDGHSSVNVFATESGRRPISAEKKVDYIKTAVGDNVNVKTTQTPFHAAAQLHKEGKRGKLVVYGGSDRAVIADRLRNYNGKEGKHGYYKFNSIEFKQVGSERKEGEKGIAGVSGSGARKSKSPAELKKFLPKELHPRAKEIFKDLQEETMNPIGIFLLGGPGSGKDYVLSNIFSRFDLTEVQIDHLLNGSADELLEQNKNIIINGSIDNDKIAVVNSMLEGYNIDYVYVSVTNKVSRLRNGLRENPLAENKRIEKWLRAEKLAESLECFKFNNSINLNESSDFEKVFFADQIEKLLARLVEHGLEMQEISEAKSFAPVRHHKSGLPAKYVKGLSPSEIAAKKAHIKRNAKLSDRDPGAYKDMPGDKRMREKGIPLSKYTKKYRAMYGEQVQANVKHTHSIEDIAAKHKVAVADIIQALSMGKQVEKEHTNDENTAEMIALAHLWEKPDYYTQLAKMEQKIPSTIKVTDADHQAAERKDQIRRDRRDWRILHHQNRHIRQAASASMSRMAEAEDKPLPVKQRKVPRSGNITAVMDKRKETGRVDEGAADKSLAAKAEKSGISLRTLKAVYRRGVAAWNSGHRPGTTPAQWGHARVNSYITKGKTYHTADKDLREETEEVDLNSLFEMQLVGTDEYRKHAIAMTPGQGEPVDAFPVKDPNKKPVAVPAKPGKSIVSQYTEEESECGCEENCGCDEPTVGGNRTDINNIKEEKENDGREDGVDFTPEVHPKKLKKGKRTPGDMRYAYLDGLPVITARVTENKESGKTLSKIRKSMPVPRQVPAPPGGHPVPPGYKRVRDHIAGWKLVKEDNSELTIKEAVEYHTENKISFTENVFRPGSEMFFELISEAKKLYKEGNYTPADEYEVDMLNSDIGEIAEYNGQAVVLDYPVEEGLEEACWAGYTQKGMKPKNGKMVPNCVPVNEEDKTGGKGIGKPWQEGGGGAVYVRVGDSVRKVSFSKSGMKKKYMDPGATRSFVARHHCLTNKDKTSASYWACRWPRFFSNSGKVWW